MYTIEVGTIWKETPGYTHNVLVKKEQKSDSRRAVVSFWQKNVHNTG